jgi:uncharacterized repeat protein (TIGR01451 family)
MSALAFLLTACGGGGSGGSGGGVGGSATSIGSGLSLRITDAPVNDADIAEVWVRFTQVIVHPADDSGDITYDVEDASDPNDIKPYRDIELKALVGGKTTLLGEIPLDAGDYDQIRLVIDPAYTHIVETGGGDYLVKCPSCLQSGFKLNRNFTIETTGWIDFTIDFDLRKSITLSQPNKPREDGHYLLRPTLRILDTALASSYIHGIVTDLRTEKDNPATPAGCWVYAYEGDAASITPDDICLDPDTSVCPPANRPLLETPVQFDTASGDYLYDTGFIYPGLYTVALVCEADDPDLDDSLLFMSESEVQADAVAGGAQQDLSLVDVPILTLLKTLDSYVDVDGSGSVTVGDTLNYLMSLGNDGNVTLTTVDLSDPLAGLSALDCGAITLPDDLAPAATLDCTATYTVLATDTTIANTATADSDQAGPVDSSVSVDVEVP